MSDTKYNALVSTLREGILDGKYAADCPFPSERALISRYGLSRNTVQRALRELVALGMIESRRGAGHFVTRHGASRKIGLIVPGVAYSEFFPPIVSEISRLSQKEDYMLLLGDISSKSPDRRVLAAKKLSREFVEQNVAGVLYQPLELVDDVVRVNREILSVFDRAGVPVVILDNDFIPARSNYAYDVVGIDNVAAGTLVAEHLLSLGVRRISFQKKPKCSASVNDRWRGVASASVLGGPPARPALLVSEPDDARAVRRHLRQFRPEAFVCGNDAAAVALKQTLEGLGKRVPDDVLLTGFDDVHFAKIVSPQLTTVRQPCEAIAGAAFRRLLDRMKDPALPPVSLSLPIELVVRGSTSRVGKSRAVGKQAGAFPQKHKNHKTRR